MAVDKETPVPASLGCDHDLDHAAFPAGASCDEFLAGLSPRTLAFTKSRAKLERRSATSIVAEALSAYGLGNRG
jgi:hypothetical protein